MATPTENLGSAIAILHTVSEDLREVMPDATSKEFFDHRINQVLEVLVELHEQLHAAL